MPSLSAANTADGVRGAGASTAEAKPEAKRVRCLQEMENSDLTAARKEFLFRTPLLTGQLVDARDEPMAHLVVNCCVYLAVVQPLMFMLARSGSGWVHALGAMNLLVHYVVLLPRFVLMLHYGSHRTPFTSSWANGLLRWILPPFFGMPCGVYKLHHTVMHHVENNHGLDISATDFYQRDSLPDFLQYWLRFSLLIWLELPMYALKTRRASAFAEIIGGLSLYFAGIALAYSFAPAAAAWSFIATHVGLMLALSFGNWSQHMFVDPDNSRSNYALAYNCINLECNQRTFNDGYHVLHHLNARLHWSELPSAFHASIDKHYKEGAITFQGLDINEVGLMVMTGQLKKLAEKYYVHLGPKDTAPTVDEVAAELKRRLAPVPGAKAAAMDGVLGKKHE